MDRERTKEWNCSCSLMKSPIAVFWFRRDIRFSDNAGLYRALKSGYKVLPIFIFDAEILDQLPKDDARVGFIHESLTELHQVLKAYNSSIIVQKGKPLDVFKQLVEDYHVKAVYSNHDFENYALKRDRKVKGFLEGRGASFHGFKDHVILEKGEVLKDDGKPYTVFTPYSRKWKKALTEYHLKAYPNEKYADALLSFQAELPSLKAIGFQSSNVELPSTDVSDELLKKYDVRRDTPSIRGTSRLGVHLRFGTISIRQLAKRAQGLNETFLNELIWRDFYAMILWHFPHVEQNAFRPAYEAINWRNDEGEFEKWCKGETGYPIVDAGMRELNATGFMHNRVRMIVASFLAKHLLIDWRWGEAYFAKKLLDFDLASNNGGWQWAAGSGCDAAPYFRVFNPELQTKKFDPELEYVKKWVPELQGFHYPEPIVEHKMARQRALDTYGFTLKK